MSGSRNRVSFRFRANLAMFRLSSRQSLAIAYSGGLQPGMRFGKVALGRLDYQSGGGSGSGAPLTEIGPVGLRAGGFLRCATAAGRGGTTGVAVGATGA